MARRQALNPKAALGDEAHTLLSNIHRDTHREPVSIRNIASAKDSPPSASSAPRESEACVEGPELQEQTAGSVFPASLPSAVYFTAVYAWICVDRLCVASGCHRGSGPRSSLWNQVVPSSGRALHHTHCYYSCTMAHHYSDQRNGLCVGRLPVFESVCVSCAAGLFLGCFTDTLDWT